MGVQRKSPCSRSQNTGDTPKLSVVGWRRQGSAGLRREYTVMHLIRCWRLSYSSKGRSIFPISSLYGTLLLPQGSGGRAQLHCQSRGSCCPTHGTPTCSQHSRQMFPGLWFVSYGAPGSSNTCWELTWVAETSCALLCSSDTMHATLLGQILHPMAVPGRRGGSGPSSCRAHLAHWSLSISIGFLWPPLGSNPDQKNISSFLASPVSSWTHF